MQYSFAPLEGITDSVYRRTHAKFYPGIARYYTPFISTSQNHRFAPRELRELAPENNPGLTLIPQLLSRNADDLLWTANALRDMGYPELDLNLGCPSGTVTAKGKGAGSLRRPDELERFLDTVFSACPIKIGIKTRIGYADPAEFEDLCAIYAKYPLCELIIHPRTAAEQYTGPLHPEVFEQAAAYCKNIPLCYNGDLRSADDIARVSRQYPYISRMMLGRGLIARPWLLSGRADRDTLRAFHDSLCREYPIVFGSENSAMHRMKAIWVYMLHAFRDAQPYEKELKKARRWPDLLRLTEEILTRCELTEQDS